MIQQLCNLDEGDFIACCIENEPAGRAPLRVAAKRPFIGDASFNRMPSPEKPMSQHVAHPFKSRRVSVGAFVLLLVAMPAVQAATTWDSQALTMQGNPAGSKTQWWFDPLNWSASNPGGMPPYFLPPTANGTSVTDAEINRGTTTLPGGEGVVYDPSSNDPNFSTAGGLTFPSGYGPQIIEQLYISRNTTLQNLLTIKGNLTIKDSGSSGAMVGRSGGSTGAPNFGSIVQTAGIVSLPTTNLDVAQWESSGWGNGVYDYRGGTLDVYNSTTNHGIRLSHGSQASGTGGIGRIIMHNPTSSGYVRTYNFTVASDRTNGDGITRGVGVAEFHFENGGTRPIQVANTLSINNGLDNSPQGLFSASTRSSRLALVLDAAPTVDINGVPQSLGLFDVNFSGLLGGTISGTGDLDGDTVFNNDRVFSSADGAKDYYPRSAWSRPSLAGINQDDFLVQAIYGGTVYKWEVSYTGTITWTDPNLGTVASVSDTDGVDVVLKGVSSGPATTIAGDYNNNNIVDAADYVVWRKNRLTANVMPNDPFGPLIADSQYNLWRANFGKTPGTGAGSVVNICAVPEPSTLVLILGGLIGVVLVRRRP
jgi:hypothetical protein